MDERLSESEPGQTADWRLNELPSVGDLCSLYSAIWNGGRSRRVEEHLADEFLRRLPEPERNKLLQHLLKVELECRRKRGERPGPSEFRNRFPGQDALIDDLFRPDQSDASPTPEESQPSDSSSGPSPRFSDLRPLAKGGLGEVFFAHDAELDREVALKEIQDRFADDGQARARFLREALITGSLEHPGIVPVYSLARHEDGRPYYAMRLIPGGSLKEAIERHHRPAEEAGTTSKDTPTLRQLLDRFVDVCNTIAYAHSRGVLHRDIKPANIMTGTYGETIVVDWGLAKRIACIENSGSAIPHFDDQLLDSALSLPGSTIGTPSYMSPEQAAGKTEDLGPASDVYSLGASLYTLLVGKPAIEGRNIEEVLRKVQEGEFASPRQANPAVSRAMEAICLKAMAKTPLDRYATATDLANDIQLWLAGDPVSAYREPWRDRVRRWLFRHRTGVTVGATSIPITVVLLVAIVLIQQWFYRTLFDTNQKLEKQTNRANRSAEESHRRLVRSNVSSGADAIEAGNMPSALPRFAEALRLDQGDSERERNHRVRLAAVLKASPKLLSLWYQKSPTRESDGSPSILYENLLIRYLFANAETKQVLCAGSGGGVHLWDFETGRAAIAPLKVPSPVISLGWSRDGRRIAAVGIDGVAHIWDSTGHLVSKIFPSPKIRHLALSPDGSQIATALADNTAIIWNTVKGTPLTPRMPHKDLVRCLTFSPDGSSLLTGCGGPTGPGFGAAQIWDTETGRPRTPLMMHRDDVHYVDFSPDGRRVVTCGYDRTARVWNASTGKPVTSELRHIDSVEFALFSPDGKHVLTTCHDWTARLWDAESGVALLPPVRHRGSIFQALFLGDGSHFVTSSYDRTVRVWDTATGEPTLAPIPHGAAVLGLAALDETTLVTASEEGLIRVWDLAEALAGATEMRHTGPVGQIALSSDGKKVVTVSDDRTARLWDAHTGVPVTPPLKHRDVVTWAAFRPDGRVVATASLDKTIHLWDVESGRPVAQPLMHDSRIRSVDFSPDGRHLVSAGDGPLVTVWDGSNQKIVLTLRHGSNTTRARFSPDGTRIVTAGLDGTARLWDAVTGVPVGAQMHHKNHVTDVEFSRDSLYVATASRDGTARVWNAATGLSVTAPLAHHGVVKNVSFSPDGNRVATASTDRTAAIWDRATGRLVAPLLYHKDDVNHVAFSHDGKWLATACGGSREAQLGEARVWDTVTGEPITPWLKHGNDANTCLFDQTDARLYTTSWDGRARIWALPVDQRPVEDLVALTRLRSGDEIDSLGGLDVVSPERLVTDHLRLSAVYPNEFKTSGDAIFASYRGCMEREIQGGRLDTAIALLTKVIALRPDDADLRARRGHCYRHQEDWGHAIDDFQTALSLSGGGSSAPPSPNGLPTVVALNFRNAPYLRELADVIHTSALKRANKKEEAAERFKWSADAWTRLADYDSDDGEARVWAGGSSSNFGLSLEGLGRSQEALLAYEQARHHLERAVREAPRIELGRKFLNIVYSNLSRSRCNLGQFDEAVKVANERRKLWLGDPEGLFVVAREIGRCAHLAETIQPKPSEERGSQARKFTERTMEVLREAVAAGFRDVGRLKDAPDLATLRAREDFQMLQMDMAFPDSPFGPR